TKEITINGKKYKVSNRSSEGNTLQYYYNTLTGQITFGGHYFTIYAQEDVEHDVILKTNQINFYGGNKNDKIDISNVGNNIYGRDGDDTITINASSSWVDGQNGNDTI